MAHLQYMPGDPRLVDQLVYELKSKGIFDQFRKECIADVDTRPAYQNLRQRVENSVSTFLARQCWKPDLNKNQLREKLRKHILDGNYLEQGVERIVDQVVNPKVASVFIPQVEDLVYNYLGISRKKSVTTAETSNGKVGTEDLLPTDLEAVSPGSVKSNDDKDEKMDTDIPEEVKMDVEEVKDLTEDSVPSETVEKPKEEETQITEAIEVILDSDASIDKSTIPLPTEDIRLENIPAPENSPPKIELENIELPKEPNISKEIPLPDQIPLPLDDVPKEQYFKPINLHSDDDSSSDSSLRRNMSPLTPIRNYNNENSCDAQQGFENDSDSKNDEKDIPSTFRFAIELKSTDNSLEGKVEKKTELNLAYQFNNQVNINTFNTPIYEESSNSNNLHIDYESDANSKFIEKVTETDHNSEDSKKGKKSEEKKSSHKSSHRSRDSHRHSGSKDKRSDSKHSTSRDSSRHDKKSKDDHSSKSKSSHRERERSRDKSEKKDSRDSSKHSSHKSSSHKDSKSHRSSSSSQRHSSKHSDRKTSSNKDKERSSEKSSDKSSKERDRKDSKSYSHRSDKDRKSSSSSSKSKHEDKDKKKDKKDTDDHYSLSGRGNHTRRSTDRDSNDGSSSSKGSNNQTSSKSSEVKKESKDSSSKSDNTSTCGESTSPSDKEVITNNASDKPQQKPIRVENHLETPIASPPRLPFVPDVTLKKPKFAANLAEAKKMMRMRKFLDEEQKRMNQEAALLLEFQANVRPSLSQVYSSIPGPELEFACVTNEINAGHVQNQVYEKEEIAETPETVILDVQNETSVITGDNEIKTDEIHDENNIEIANDDDSMNTEALLGNETYNENKPFSQLVNEISERNKHNDVKFENLHDDENKMRTEYFEVTIITEELSETDEPDIAKDKIENIIEADNSKQDSENLIQDCEIINQDSKIIKPDSEKTKPDSENRKQHSKNTKPDSKNTKQDCETDKAPESPLLPHEEELHYFAEHEKYDAELKRHQFSNFLKTYTDQNSVLDKIYLFNCNTYEENILKEVCLNFGSYEIINYYRNGHLSLPKPAKNVNVNLATEFTLPVDTCDNEEKSSSVFSPVKSECSFELSSDYDAKLEEMVNKTSRQEVMEIILGSVTDRPTIDYCTESSIESSVSLKRKEIEAESTVNNNRPVLIPKIRKLSESDQISSTTEESEEISNNNRLPDSTRSKYLGRARRVGLPRPKRTNLQNSPSSDKSVENYAQNTPAPPNGKLKATPRAKVQRYDTSDLYKPKLHYLSRRNNIS